MRERGAAYAEFAITLPVLLLLVFSLVAMSRLLGNLSFLIPTSYESYLAGSMAPDGAEQGQMGAVCNLFRSTLKNDVQNPLCAASNFELGSFVWTLPATGNDVVAETVSISLPSQLGQVPLSGMGILSLNLGLTGVRVTRNMVVANEGSFDSILPDTPNTYWGCDGQVVDAEPDEPCLPI